MSCKKCGKAKCPCKGAKTKMNTAAAKTAKGKKK